jgi:uncharacterized lipoprotein YddW (UPF0748 family)
MKPIFANILLLKMILQTIFPKIVTMKNFFQNKRTVLLVYLLVFLFQTLLLAQTAPKRELRGVWIASVLNIDYPSVKSTSEWVLKEEWIKLLEKHKAMGMNALFVQIRPVADAFYPSAIVPWSSYLSGQSGVAPSNNFDPLAFMIASAHGYGFEFHAWLNPYRASMDNQTSADFAPNHVMRAHPEWCVRYGKRFVLNPGLPEVRAHFNDVIAEIVQKYDVDGIHFDDYFYPYKIANELFADGSTYQKYGAGFQNLDDWRRNNVDLMVAGVSKLIKKIKPRVQFGISPFGVWRNADKDPEGSKTQAGLTCYDDLYADVRKWLRTDWIDYVAPQVYWNIGFQVAEFKTIVKWWADNSAGKTIYVGLGAYRIGTTSSKEVAWQDPAEIGRQIGFSRSMKGVKGAIFFSSKSLINNPLGIIDTLSNKYFSSPSLTPQVVKDTMLLACESPEMRDVTVNNGEVILRWKPSMTTQRRYPFQYIIYRFENGNIDFTNGKNILARVPCDSKHLEYFDKTIEEGLAYTYAVTVVDIQNQESPAETLHEIGQIKKPKSPDITSKSGKNANKNQDKKGKGCGFFRRLFGGC